MAIASEIVKKKSGYKLHVVPTAKYKTNTLVLKMKAPLIKETVIYAHCFHMFYKVIQVNTQRLLRFELI